MKIRILIISVFTVLVASSMLPGKDNDTIEPTFGVPDSTTLEKAPPFPSPVTEVSPRATMIRRPNTATLTQTPRVLSTTPTTSSKQLEIFELRYAKAEDLASIIENVFPIDVYVDYRLNRVIVNAMEENMKSIANLIAMMDVAAPAESMFQDVQNLVYRIYMFETSSGDKDLKPFSMILRTSTHVSSQELLDVTVDKDLQISEFLQSPDFNEPHVEIQIQGKAASNESLKRMVSGLAPESHIIELKWEEDETFTNNIASAQYTQLSEQMQKHIRKFLGDNIMTVGYWFGNLSTPGEVQAPIGPWTMKLRLDTESDRMLEFDVNVEIPDEINPFFHTQLGREQKDEILSNTIRAKIGKPILIGYNRESYGSRKMGAMVIVPEVDMIQSEEIKSNF
jgi:hypothetical protein